MKIEIGESLVYSWLRHIKKCQIAQMNWKPSTEWGEKKNDYSSLQQEISQEFTQYDIFKKNSNMNQFFKQAEIDVVGIAQQSNETTIYMADVAFHEFGLNYGSKNETIARVLKKYIRSYLIYRTYFSGIPNGIILFITPKMSYDTIYLPLKDAIERLIRIFQSNDQYPDFKLLANEEFNHEVLSPVIKLSQNVKDTNELFLRSAQLWTLFVTKPVTSKNKIMSTQNETNQHTTNKTVSNINNTVTINNQQDSKMLSEVNTGDEMNDTQLKRAIQSIGKGCFVKYYEQFSDMRQSKEDLIDLLMKNEGYKESACSTRVTNSRRIIKSGRAKDVLIEITQSEKLDDDVKTQARKLLREF